ncbi:MAG: cell wall hydrolase [Butyricicoccus sp.]|nr:cell wall hydrolase [Butyricicoccus sp.]
MSKRIKTSFAIICVVVILASIMSGYATAEDDVTYGFISESDIGQDSSEAVDMREPLILAYTEIPLYVDGVFSGIALKLNDTTYAPLLSFCEAMLMEDFEVLWDSETDSVSLSAEGVDISLTLSDNYIVANGRYLYLPDGAYNINGSVVAPIRELAKIFNVSIEWDEDNWSIDIDTSDLSIIGHGWQFYDYDSLYWLSRVIFSESGETEPIEGMIGVGNVVLNRVNDDSGMFEDTVRGVIFQYNQFSVVDNGTIYLEPNDISVIAAKLCLEGYNTVGDSLFFLNPDIAPSYWFRETRTFVVTIENHDFYA